MKKLDVGSIVIFKHDHFPAKKDQAGVVISIQNKIYRIRFDWILLNFWINLTESNRFQWDLVGLFYSNMLSSF
jgi:hypothetical protein